MIIFYHLSSSCCSVAILAQVSWWLLPLPYLQELRFMDALTLVLVGCLDDDTVVAFSSTSRINLGVVEAYREVALARALLRLLQLLTVHTGANTTREWQDQDYAEETVWFLSSVVPDWDLSD